MKKLIKLVSVLALVFAVASVSFSCKKAVPVETSDVIEAEVIELEAVDPEIADLEEVNE